MRIQTSKLVKAGGGELQDRAEIFELAHSTVAVVADGAGGRSGGAQAADMVIKMVREHTSAGGNLDSTALCNLLRNIDSALDADVDAGETTVVIVAVSPFGISGASVGDSAAWLIRGVECTDLTRHQQRKPFLGTGVASPAPFEEAPDSGALLLASDGLIKYTSAERICGAASLPDMELAALELLSLVRYPSGSLPDDVSVVLLRWVC
jgi:serine/threonine protein phosphatase PrpC